MPLHELAALGAAACWALSGILAPGPIAQLGALAFNRWRQVFAALMFAAVVLASGTWRQFGADTVVPLVLSGLIGIFLGNSLLFTAGAGWAAAGRGALRAERAHRGAARLAGAGRDAGPAAASPGWR